jgi:hypothetical protein
MPDKKKAESAELEFLLSLLTDPLQRQVITLLSERSDPSQVLDALLKRKKHD